MILRDRRISTPKFLLKATRADARARENSARRVLHARTRLFAAQLVTTKRQIVPDIAELSRNGNKASCLIFIRFLNFLPFFHSSVLRPTAGSTL